MQRAGMGTELRAGMGTGTGLGRGQGRQEQAQLPRQASMVPALEPRCPLPRRQLGLHRRQQVKAQVQLALRLLRLLTPQVRLLRLAAATACRCRRLTRLTPQEQVQAHREQLAAWYPHRLLPLPLLQAAVTTQAQAAEILQGQAKSAAAPWP